MSEINFREVFTAALGEERAPYAYQCRLACGPDADPEKLKMLEEGRECESLLIDIPTGLGKTAAVVLAWLWNRVLQPKKAARERWPRRLVYCLPMRTLVEQTRKNVSRWLENLDLLWDAKGNHAGKVGLHILMGGEDCGEWDIHPEREAVLIGTQDMLLSRALNRGYGMRRYDWPRHFGLLNNDVLWVLDETQLMGPGLATACQLEAFRSETSSGFGSFHGGQSATWYMSATNSLGSLRTRDWRSVERPEGFAFGLAPREKSSTSGPIHQRRVAVKRLEVNPTLAISAGPAVVAKCVIARHIEMVDALIEDPLKARRTLVLCNTVDRAVEIRAEIKRVLPSGCDLVLLHSRFRPPERRAKMLRIENADWDEFPKGQIVIATQVIEAGVDITSGALWSEVAPLSSLVQRLGRLNRSGEFNQSTWKPIGTIFGVGVQNAPVGEKKERREKREKENVKCCLPYQLSACIAALQSLEKLKGDASPASFEAIRAEIVESIPKCPYSLQRHELADFFDTDANLSLGYTDVSPFVRGLDDDTDVQVCWREFWPTVEGRDGVGKPDFTPDYQQDEFCSVPISKAFNARDVLNHGWIWRGRESGWVSVRDAGIAPGMTILLPLEAGGYDEELGWTGLPKGSEHASHYKPREELTDADRLSYLNNGWRSIAAHTAEVDHELVTLLRVLLPESNCKQEHDALLIAVQWHDVGKNYSDWQQAVFVALEKAGITGKDEYRPFAKFSLAESPSLRGLANNQMTREVARLKRSFCPGVAHEVASALAFRQAEQQRLGLSRDTNLPSLLAEYVIMSHHGRVRKVLRDEVPRFPSDEKDTETVRGIVNGTALPPVSINGQNFGCVSTSTDCRKMGRGASGHESYTRAVLRLLDHYGPFRLAYMEAVFRAADVRASIAASREAKG